MKVQLRKKSFKKWLESLDKERVVGKTCSSNSCPIAIYVRTVFDLPEAVVLDTSWRKSDDEEDHVLPGWAKLFVWEVDHLDKYSGGFGVQREVRSSDALAILEKE